MSELLTSLKKILPELNTITDSRSLENYFEDNIFKDEKPIGVVKPSTVKQLRDLVVWSGKNKLRLQPISSKGPHYRGDTRCSANTVIVDMCEFNQVIRANRRNRVLLFESAVTFDRLVEAAKSVNLQVMLPLCPKPGKSALTSYIDREPTISPRFQWDLSDPMLCIEMILGTGELFRTGAAAGPGDLADQWKAGDAQKFPEGPGASNLMRVFQGSQGAYGIVTWTSTKAEVAAIDERLYVISSDSIEPLIEITYGILRRDHPDICFILDGAGLAAIQHRDPEQWDSSRNQKKPWNLMFSLSKAPIAGQDKLDYVQEEIQALCAANGVADQFNHFEAKHQDLHNIITQPAHPVNQVWWKLAGQESTQELFLQTTLDQVPTLLKVAQQQCEQNGWDYSKILHYVQPQVGCRCCHLEFIFPHKSFELPMISNLLSKLTRELKQKGGFFSRPHGPSSKDAVEGEPGVSIAKRVGKIFDPDNIFSPNALRYLNSEQEN